MQTSIWEMLAMVLYLVLVVGVGVYFFVSQKTMIMERKNIFSAEGIWAAGLPLFRPAHRI